MGRLAAGLGITLLVALVPSTATATWSIVAVDPQTQEVGVAVASCVPAPFGTTILPYVAGLAPGVGALAAQAQYSQARRDQALALLTGGASPQEVLDGVLASDGQAAVRQYGVVTLDGQTAAFTGAATQAWAGDLSGFGVTVQGNILYGPEVVGDALAAFEQEPARCPFTLADRLMLALEAGAAQGGDNRCSMEQSAQAAALRVARPGDDPKASFIDLRIPSQPEGGPNPVTLLRAEYDQWRLRNPPDDSGCGSGTSSGTGGADGTATTAGADDTAGTTGATSPSPDGGLGSDEGPAPTVGSGAPATPTSAPASSSGEPSDGDGSGCACHTRPTTPPSAPPSAWLGLIVLALRRRPRR